MTCSCRQSICLLMTFSRSCSGPMVMMACLSRLRRSSCAWRAAAVLRLCAATGRTASCSQLGAVPAFHPSSWATLADCSLFRNCMIVLNSYYYSDSLEIPLARTDLARSRKMVNRFGPSPIFVDGGLLSMMLTLSELSMRFICALASRTRRIVCGTSNRWCDLGARLRLGSVHQADRAL
jgi:hypothetical protein